MCKKNLFFVITFIFTSQISFGGTISLYAETTFGSVCPYAWEQNLKMGNVSPDVQKLQQFLNENPDTAVSLSGVGSRGYESSYFGAMTKFAVIKFQQKFSKETLVPAGLSEGTGFLGVLTRTKLNSLCIASSNNSVSANVASVVESVSASAVSVSADSSNSAKENVLTVLSPAQPEPTLAPGGAGGVKFTLFTLTAGSSDVTVNSITVERVGWGADGAFDSIGLFDEDGNAIGNSRGFRSNHKVDLGDPFVISAGESKTFSIEANMALDLSGYDGQMPVLQLVAIDTSTKILGNFPIKGTAQTINSSLVIGSATARLSQFDPATNLNRYINDTGVRFSGIRLAADSKEDLSLSSITWDQTGTVGNQDVANVVTVLNGISYPTKIAGRKFTSTFEPPVIIKKGYSVDVYIQGDLKPSGVNRTVKFDINSSGDIALLGESYGYYVLIYPEGSIGTSGNSVFITSTGDADGDEGVPFFSGSVVTINGGTFTGVGKSSR